jgi:hypothetical protein
MNVIVNHWFIKATQSLHNKPFEFESDNDIAAVKIDLQLSMQEKLARAIDNERCNEYCE